MQKYWITRSFKKKKTALSTLHPILNEYETMDCLLLYCFWLEVSLQFLHYFHHVMAEIVFLAMWGGVTCS